MSKPLIGFIGVGIMGAPMVAHLARAGYKITLYDINNESARKIASSFPGMVVANSPKALAQASDVVITMLPSGKHVQDLALGDSGLIEGFKRGALLIDTSSSEPWLTIETARALNDKKVAMVDAPVSGAQQGAQKAELVFMVGGEKGSVDSAMPILNAMGKTVFHLGTIGTGHAMKCINNMITAMTFMATAEGLALGKKMGLDPSIMTDVLNSSTGMSWISQTQIKQRIINRKFDDAFKLCFMVKDIGIALSLADQLKIPLPMSALGLHLWKASVNYADKDSSISKMVSWVEHVTKTKIIAN